MPGEGKRIANSGDDATTIVYNRAPGPKSRLEIASDTGNRNIHGKTKGLKRIVKIQLLTARVNFGQRSSTRSGEIFRCVNMSIFFYGEDTF